MRVYCLWTFWWWPFWLVGGDSVQFSQSWPTLYDPMDCSTPGFPKLMSIKLAKPSNHLILCCPLPLSPSIFPSIRVFSSKSALRNRWRNYWSFSFSINPSNEYSGLISFRIDWFDLLPFQGTFKSLLQDHSLKTLILWCSAFFMFQLSHPHRTTGKKHSFDYTDLCWQSDVSAF